MKNINDYPKYEKISKEQVEQMAAAFNRYLGNMRETVLFFSLSRLEQRSNNGFGKLFGNLIFNKS
jgi:hypothetical protein